MYGVRCNADRFYITQSSECKNALAVGYNTAVLFWMYSVSNASMILTIILNNFLAQASPFLTAYMYMYNPMHEGFRQLEFYGTHTRCAVVVAWKCMWDLKKTRVHFIQYTQCAARAAACRCNDAEPAWQKGAIVVALVSACISADAWLKHFVEKAANTCDQPHPLLQLTSPAHSAVQYSWDRSSYKSSLFM